MLERETEIIRQIVIESTINGHESIQLNDVVSAHLPRGVKSFMIAEVMKLLEEDFRQSHILSQITKGIGPTVLADRSLLRSLAMQYVLRQEEYLKLVEDTVHFLENYLCRPQWTLGQMMFEKDAPITFEMLARKFERVVDYSYFGVLVERHARRKNLREIEPQYFKDLIAKIDQEVTRQHSPRELALLAKPIFDYLLFGDSSTSRPIPLGAILLFFEDKKMTGVKEYIERICQVRSRTQISMNELIGMLEDLYQVETTVKEDVHESEQEILNPVGKPMQSEPSAPEAAREINEGATEADVAASANAASPENNNLIEPPPMEESAAPEGTTPDATELDTDRPRAATKMEPIVNADELVAYARDRETRRFAAFLTFPDRPTVEELQADLPDINEMLTDAQRTKFVSKIFNNDENSCFVFLTSLNRARTWREAQPYLRDLFEMNKLDIRSPDVVEFTDAMQARFHPELRKAE